MGIIILSLFSGVILRFRCRARRWRAKAQRTPSSSSLHLFTIDCLIIISHSGRERTAKFAFGENQKFTGFINVPFICSPACRFVGTGQGHVAVTGSVIARCWMAKNSIREVSKLLGWQTCMTEQRNKKPCPYDFIFSPKMDKSNWEQGWNSTWRGRKQENHCIFHVFVKHNKTPSLTVFIPVGQVGSVLRCTEPEFGLHSAAFGFLG